MDDNAAHLTELAYLSIGYLKLPGSIDNKCMHHCTSPNKLANVSAGCMIAAWWVQAPSSKQQPFDGLL
jgi:hypothetical protein